jgi:hypothetical protein
MFFSKKADGEIHWPFLFLIEQVRVYQIIQIGNIISAQPLGLPFQEMTKYVVKNAAVFIILDIHTRVQP